MGQPVDITVLEQPVVQVHKDKRKLVTIRTINELNPIPNADAIEVATVGGWKLVVKKGEFKVGDLCVYFEIDSFLPDGNPAWQFLVDKSSREFNGRKGHKLRTIKLRGQTSQGLALPLRALPTVQYAINDPCDTIAVFGNMSSDERIESAALLHQLENGEDMFALNLTALLGVEKYEPPLAPELAGQAEGLFPSFIPKTDEERAQNIVPSIFGYQSTKKELDITPDQLDASALESGRVIVEDGKVFAVSPAKADVDTIYEVSIKADGSSMTGFGRLIDGEVDGKAAKVYDDGVCSRNLQLKINEANAGNTFVDMFVGSGLREAIKLFVEETGRSIALQGELMGPGIQGNREDFKEFQFFLFNVYLIDLGRHAAPFEREDIFKKLLSYGVINVQRVQHIPVLENYVKLSELGIHNIADLIAFADGPSINNPVREGLVFKRMDGQFSFKIISNQYLIAEKD